jgi:hypothetical protein
MLSRIASHIRGNAIAYVALFASLGGTSYAAVRLAPGSVTTQALANGAVSHAKLASGSVGTSNIRKASLTAGDFRAGALAQALGGAKGAPGPAGPAGQNGNGSVVLRARSTGSVSAPNGTSTNVPLTATSWTQAASELNLITGSMDIGIPASCTGSFGNSLVISVDGVPNTFGVAPTSPASSTVTVPFQVSELMEPGSSKQHTVTAKLANSCTKAGEAYTVSNVKLDVVTLH